MDASGEIRCLGYIAIRAEIATQGRFSSEPRQRKAENAVKNRRSINFGTPNFREGIRECPGNESSNFREGARFRPLFRSLDCGIFQRSMSGEKGQLK